MTTEASDGLRAGKHVEQFTPSDPTALHVRWLEIKTSLVSEAVPDGRKALRMNTTDPLSPRRLFKGLSRETEDFNNLLKLGYHKPTKKTPFKLWNGS